MKNIGLLQLQQKMAFTSVRKEAIRGVRIEHSFKEMKDALEKLEKQILSGEIDLRVEEQQKKVVE